MTERRQAGSHRWIVLCAAWLALAVVHTARAGQVIFVNCLQTNVAADGRSWMTAFPSLQAGIAAAAPGDELWVGAGTYRPFVLDKAVQVFGGFSRRETRRSERDWIANPCRIVPEASSSLPSLAIITGSAEGPCRVDGLVFEGGGAPFGAGIRCSGPVVLANNLIVNNAATGGSGLGGGVLIDATRPVVVREPGPMFRELAQRLLDAHTTTNLVADGAGGSNWVRHVAGVAVRPEFCLTNIALRPVSEYQPSIHRLLQLAANLYGGLTNQTYQGRVLPWVFRPRFLTNEAGVFIAGYEEEAGTACLHRPFRDLDDPEDRIRLQPDDNVYDVPLIFSATERMPNFNEFTCQTVVQVSRYVELRKANANDVRPSATNALYALSISNQFGLEAWNAFKDAYGSPLQLRVQSWHTAALSVSNATAHPQTLISSKRAFLTNLTLESWPAGQFQVVVASPLLLLSNVVYNPILASGDSPFVPASTNMTFPTHGDVLPDFVVHCTNRLQYALVDPDANRLIDMVSFRGLNTTVPITVHAYESPSQDSGLSHFWLTSRIGGATNASVPTRGLLYQIEASLGNMALSAQQMRDWCLPADVDRSKATDVLRHFCGLSPICYRTPEQGRILQRELAGKLAVQVPFVFTAKFADTWSWEVNDPTVHYLAGDLRIPGILVHGFPSGTTRSLCSSWNVQLPLVSLGRTNAVYYSTAAKRTQSPAQFDLELDSADAWDFPVTPLVNLHWLDRVHRGTPWQTVYLGGRIGPNLALSYPATAAALNSTNDWPLARLWLENRLFPETGPALPSDVVLVNNTVVGNRAASGGGIAIADGATPTLINNVFVSNSEGVARMGAAEVTLRANDVFGNSGGDYLGLAAGPTDFSVDPRFVAVSAGDFRLDPASPLLGKGDPLALDRDWLMADETARFRGVGLEVGAAEFRPALPWLSVSIHPAEPPTLPSVLLEGFGDLPCVLEASVDLAHWETVAFCGTATYSFEFHPPPTLAKDAVFFRARLAEP